MCKADKSINRRCFGFLMSLLICLLLAGALPAASAESIEENEYGYIDAVLDSRNGIPEDAEGRLALIRETGVLRVATEPYFAPQEYIDPSQYGQARYVGSDMELARMIAERMGVSLEIVPMKFTRLLPSLALGDCDLAISAISYTPERADQYTLSMGYCVSEKAEGPKPGGSGGKRSGGEARNAAGKPAGGQRFPLPPVPAPDHRPGGLSGPAAREGGRRHGRHRLGPVVHRLQSELRPDAGPGAPLQSGGSLPGGPGCGPEGRDTADRLCQRRYSGSFRLRTIWTLVSPACPECRLAGNLRGERKA